MVITALPGSDGTDDQPYDKKRRSDMHFDLRDIIFSKTKRRSAAISDLTFGSVAGFHRDSLTSTDSGNIPFPDSATACLGEHMNREHLNGSISVCNDVDVNVAAERCLFQKPGSWYDALRATGRNLILLRGVVPGTAGIPRGWTWARFAAGSALARQA